jgi:hypothetical protein
LDKKRADSIAPAGPLPFLLGMGIGYSLFYAFLSVSEELWGAGLVFGIILMLVFMHRRGMNFEFSEARLIKNRKEFNPHILFTAKWISVFFLIAWIFISHVLHVQHLLSLVGLFIGVGVYLAVYSGFNGLFGSAIFVVNIFKPSLNYQNVIATPHCQFTDAEIERTIPVPLAPPRFASLIARP